MSSSVLYPDRSGNGMGVLDLVNPIKDSTANVADFGGSLNGVTPDDVALLRALKTGVPVSWTGTLLLSAPIIMPIGSVIRAINATSDASLKSSSVLRRGFSGALPLITMQDDCIIEYLDIDGMLLGTADNILARGSRLTIRNVSSRRATQDGLRVGDNISTNANLINIENYRGLNNVRDGLNVDDTAVDGGTDANAGLASSIDCRYNGRNGITVNRAFWFTFVSPISQSNVGYNFEITDNANSINVFGGDLEAGGVGQGIIRAGARACLIVAGLKGVGKWTNQSPVGTNTVNSFNDNAQVTVTGDQVNIVNNNAGGEAVVNLRADTGEDLVAQVRGSKGTGTTGRLRLGTKRAGDIIYDGIDMDELQRTTFLRSRADTIQKPTYSASIATDAAAGNVIEIRATNGTAFTIAAPTNPIAGIPLKYTIYNASGGSLGAVTWNAIFKMAAWASPANGACITITFYWNGTNWIEDSRSSSITF